MVGLLRTRSLWQISLLLAIATVRLVAQEDRIDRASQLELQGKFKEAAGLLQEGLKDAERNAALRKQYEFELDRLDRIKMDFSLTKDRLYQILQKSVRDVTQQEFEQWVREGRFETRMIDGTVYFVGVSRSNLFFRYPSLKSRRIDASDDSSFEHAVWENCVAIKHAARKEFNTYVLPKRFRTTMTVTAKSNAAPDGEVIRAWLPIPKTFPHQKDFEVVTTSSQPKTIALDNSPIRSVYFEQAAQKDKPTEFKIEYQYTGYGVFFDLKAAGIQPLDAPDESLKQFSGEGPHVVFTEKIKNLSDELAGNEKNPMLKARRFYNWITEKIQYSFALEYSTIRNISDYCLEKKYGDCGQEALLFITLCRYNGIPARWQSAWFTFPGGKTIHDWTEIYLKPYGWVPVDPYMGIFAMQYMTNLSSEQAKEVRDFYFGGLDQYRMAANSDHNQELTPPKQSLRSDNVDFQRGEMEYGTTNIYFNKYSYKLEIQELGKAQ
jgi:transglutaminase-like putative cysteine protease